MKKIKQWNWWKIGAWTAAAAVLCGALVYFNLPEEKVVQGKLNGACPDFTLDYVFASEDGKMVVDEDATFTLSEHKGDVVVLNFWATNCEPCKKEMPYFNRLYETYSDEGLEVVILNGEFYITAQQLLDYALNSTSSIDYQKFYKDWATYTCTFGRYEEDNNIRELFDVGSANPLTIIVGRDGNIKYMKEGSLSYEKLESLVVAELEIFV